MPLVILFLALAALLRPAAAESGDPRSVPSEAAALPALIDVAGPLDGLYLFDKALIARSSGGDMTPDGDGWQLLTPDRLDQGFTGDDFLVRFGLTNSSEGPRSVVFAHDIAFLDRMTVATRSAARPDHGHVLSNADPFSARIIEFPGLAYESEVLPGETLIITVELAMDDPQPMTLGMRLWDPASFERYAAIYQAKFIAVSTVLMTMAIIWTIFAVVMQRWRLLLYAGYLSCMSAAAFLFYGFGYQYLFPESPRVHALGFQGQITGAFGFAALFAATHLNLKTTAPFLGRLNTGLATILLAGGILAIAGIPKAVTIPLSLLSLLMPFWLLMVSFVVFLRDRRLFVFLFTAAWTFMGLTALVLFLLIFFGFMPGAWTVAQNYEAFAYATLAEILFLTLSVALSIRNLQEERDRAAHAASIDPLTGLLNRRGFEVQANQVLADDDVGRWWLALLDLDRFKSINDTFGHAAGDEVLRDFASGLRRLSRQADLISRIGGEEFAILFPAPSAEDAVRYCERIRMDFATNPTIFKDRKIRHFVSIGLASGEGGGQGPGLTDLIHRADQALYAAKRNGRNRLEMDDGAVHRPIEAELRPAPEVLSC